MKYIYKFSLFILVLTAQVLQCTFDCLEIENEEAQAFLISIVRSRQIDDYDQRFVSLS